MSVTFSIRGQRSEAHSLNLSQSNAANLLEWLRYHEFAEDLVGAIPAKQLQTRCLEALQRPLDASVAGEETKGEGGAVYIRCERWPGYLHEKTRELLELSKKAGDLGVIRFY